MTANMLLSELESRGIYLFRHGDRIHWKAPKGVVTAELKAKIRDHKPELLPLLPLWEEKSSITEVTQRASEYSQGLSQRLEKYLPVLAAAESNPLPPGPVDVAPGVTVFDPKLFVSGACRYLTPYAEQSSRLNPTTEAGLDRRCKWLDDIVGWLHHEGWAGPHA